MEQQFDQSQLDPQVLNVVKALAYTETGGNIKNPPAGQSGELASTFQFTPGTWKGYSREIAGQELPMTRENEAAVVYGKVQKWLQEGYHPEEIASIWNSGKPDAYLHDHVGVNKQGVKYDVPGYVKKFSSYLAKFEGKSNTPAQPNPVASQSSPPPLANKPASTGLLPNALAASTPQAKSPLPLRSV